MQLIDAEQINFNDAFIGQSDFARDTREAAERLVKMQAVINPAQILINQCKGCIHDDPEADEECMHCMRAYSGCYYKP